MKLRRAALTLVSLAAIASTPSWAQTMKPGLWEVTNKMTSDDPRFAQQMEMAQKMFANMPPEQRKMMEEAMAKHGGGAKMPTMKDGAVAVKTCVTREMVEQQRFDLPTKGHCTQNRSPIVGSSMKVSFHCTQPEASGEGEVHFLGDTGYTVRMKTSTPTAGPMQNMTVEGNGKWLGADCGDVKPVQMPPKARP